MEFTAESDQEYLHELFGDDTPALFECVIPHYSFVPIPLIRHC